MAITGATVTPQNQWTAEGTQGHQKPGGKPGDPLDACRKASISCSRRTENTDGPVQDLVVWMDKTSNDSGQSGQVHFAVVKGLGKLIVLIQMLSWVNAAEGLPYGSWVSEPAVTATSVKGRQPQPGPKLGGNAQTFPGKSVPLHRTCSVSLPTDLECKWAAVTESYKTQPARGWPDETGDRLYPNGAARIGLDVLSKMRWEQNAWTKLKVSPGRGRTW